MSYACNSTELRRLLADWSNGVLTPEDGEKLSHVIETSAEARQLYLEYVAVESELLATHAATSLHKIHQMLEKQLDSNIEYDTVSGDEFENELGSFADLAYLSQLSGARNDKPQNRMPNSAVWLLAASIAAVATVFGLLFLKGEGSDSPQLIAHHESEMADPITRDPSAGQVIAHITASRNCRWANPSLAVGYGAELVTGQQLHLDAGLAEITFTDGTQVILEGPAKLNLSTDTESILLSGRLAATLPAGFSTIPVRTSRMGVVGSRSVEGAFNDRAGLHFGLSADSATGEEVHVFHGKLQAFLLGERQEQHSLAVDLVSREAARIQPASTTVAKFFANRDMFVQSISSTGGPQDGLFAYEGFDYPEGPLSGQNGGFGWAGAWADIEAACPPGQLATNIAMEGNLNFRTMRAIGGHAAQIKQQNRIRRAISTSLGGVFDSASLVENQDGQRLVGANGKTVYLSFLQQVSQTDDGFYGVELHRGDGNRNRVFCLGNGADGAGYGVTSNFNAYGMLNYQRLGKETTDVNFVVVKIEFGPFNSDQVTVYRNPESLLNEELSDPDAVLQGNFAFDRISFGNFDGTKEHGIDELRVGTTYRAVTGLRDRGDERLTPSFAQIQRQNKNEQVEYKKVLSLHAWNGLFAMNNEFFKHQLIEATRFATYD